MAHTFMLSLYYYHQQEQKTHVFNLSVALVHYLSFFNFTCNQTLMLGLRTLLPPVL